MTRLGASPLGVRSSPRYRTVRETDVVDLLLVYGWAHELRRAGRPALEGEVRDAVDGLIRDGLPCEVDGSGTRRFDAAEVINFVKRSGLERRSRLWEERFVATGRRLLSDFSGRSDPAVEGPPRLETVERQFNVTLARDFHLPHVEGGTRVRLRLPLPLEDLVLRDLSIVTRFPPGIDAETAIAPGRLDVRLTMPRTPSIGLAVDLSFKARPTLPDAPPAPLDADAAALYTRPKESIIVVTPRVRELAAGLSGRETDRWTVVQRFRDFLLDRLQYGVLHYDEVPATAPVDWVLDNGWYDCQLGSALFVALCRASGIPARLVGGYLLYPTAATNHHWSEFWLDDRGWTPFDLGCWDLSLGGRDASWRDVFCGRLDYRMKTHVMPHLFTGTPTVRFPQAWRLMQRLEGDGVSLEYADVGSGARIFRDRVSVRLVEPTPGPPPRS